MTTIEVRLPWTSPPLSLNDRGGWQSKAKKTAIIRRATHLLAAKHHLPHGVDHLTVQLHYRPRDNRRRDTDNLVATLKPICDALAAGAKKHPGYGVVPDDTPQWMSKPEPIIHPAVKGEPGRLWLTLTITNHTAEHELADRYTREGDHQ